MLDIKLTGRKHELKTWPSILEEVKSGKKKFEYRRNDRDFAVGDVLILKGWDPGSRYYSDDAFGKYPSFEVVVTSILEGRFGVPEKFCVMSIVPKSVFDEENAPKTEPAPPPVESEHQKDNIPKWIDKKKLYDLVSLTRLAYSEFSSLTSGLTCPTKNLDKFLIILNSFNVYTYTTEFFCFYQAFPFVENITKLGEIYTVDKNIFKKFCLILIEKTEQLIKQIENNNV